jgi:hypothetical protein
MRRNNNDRGEAIVGKSKAMLSSRRSYSEKKEKSKTLCMKWSSHHDLNPDFDNFNLSLNLSEGPKTHFDSTILKCSFQKS